MTSSPLSADRWRNVFSSYEDRATDEEVMRMKEHIAEQFGYNVSDLKLRSDRMLCFFYAKQHGISDAGNTKFLVMKDGNPIYMVVVEKNDLSFVELTN